MSTDAEKLKQKQKIRKYLVFTGMFLLFLGCMWLIFAPSEKDRQEAERKTGFNAELPDPKMDTDRIMSRKQNRRRTLQVKMKAVRTIQEETAGREPSPLQPRLTTTSTPLSVVFTRVLRKTRKRKP